MAKSKSLPSHAVCLTTFAELEPYVLAFGAGHLNLLMIFGPPGVGKSRSVRQALGNQVCWIGGQATPFGIYLQAYEHQGKWSGGLPILGYDVDPQVLRLVVNPKEATRVRAIFDLYLKHQALLPVVRELERRGWRNKAWVTRKGRKMGGQPFIKTNLHMLLTNPTYAGKLRYKTELHNGEHAAIVDPAKWQKVQEMLQYNRHKGSTERNGSGAILKG